MAQGDAQRSLQQDMSLTPVSFTRKIRRRSTRKDKYGEARVGKHAKKLQSTKSGDGESAFMRVVHMHAAWLFCGQEMTFMQAKSVVHLTGRLCDLHKKPSHYHRGDARAHDAVRCGNTLCHVAPLGPIVAGFNISNAATRSGESQTAKRRGQ